GDCAFIGDRVCDTEPHKRPSGCPSGPNGCTGLSYNNTQYNIMNYSSCRNRFSAGQRERFIAAFDLRSSLVNSSALYPPDAALASTCTPILLNPASGQYMGT